MLKVNERPRVGEIITRGCREAANRHHPTNGAPPLHASMERVGNWKPEKDSTLEFRHVLCKTQLHVGVDLSHESKAES